MKCIFYCASLFLLASGSVFAQKSRMNVFLQQNELMFNVSYNNRPVIENSSLGIIMDNCPYGKNIKSFSETESSDESIRSYLANGVHNSFYVDVKEFDDGIAFRYRIPANGPKCVYGESTSFVFPSNTTAWYASGPFQYGWHQIYQERKTDSIEGELLAPPATFLTQEGIYAAITEANLFNFHGAVMYCTAPNKIQFGYADNKGHIETGIETGLPPAKYWHEAVRNNPWIAYPDKNEIKTPWRVLMLADDLNGLVNNKIISQVCDKPDNALFSDSNEWIKPGRAVFTWLTEGGVERLSVANHKKYIDGCAELGIESVVVDDGWENWAQTEKEANGRDKWAMLKELVEYAAVKTRKDGKDLIVVFNGKGSGITADEFAPKLIGRKTNGELLYGYADLPYVDYSPSILSAGCPVYDAEKNTLKVKVTNFGLSASQPAEIEIICSGKTIAKGNVGSLQPYEEKELSLKNLQQQKPQTAYEVVLSGNKKEIERTSFQISSKQEN